MIRVLNAKNDRLAEIYRKIVEKYGQGDINEGNVRKLSVVQRRQD